ncbi:MAG TPA: glycoside hydrolase family 28 protein [Cyclobacteriaceae bacterium]|nr:glycoside hydrolase family 28 protein [Cyclobacteriaceae bacterium]
MKSNYILPLLFTFILLRLETMAQADIYSDLKFKMERVAEPTFPNYSVSIKDFGAVPDGSTVCTKAFADAIDAVSKKGGGKVIVPRGIWLTGPIQLKSNINLYTEDGALITFTKNYDDYPLIETSFEGLNTVRCLSPINGKGLENIAITGHGVFDGSGEVWRPVKKSKLTSDEWKKLVASGGVLNEANNTWYPTERSLKGAKATETFNVPANLKSKEEWESVKEFLRPVMLSLSNCKKVLLDGPTFQNSPAWCLHPLMSENVTLRNLTIRNPWYSQNGDGLDLESCKNVVIEKCHFDVGDDAICFKSGKDKDGRLRGIPTENVIVDNCVVYHGHGGFVVGSEMSGGVKNVKVSNCTFIGTDVGLRFKSNRGRGGVVENIYIDNINMVNIPAEALLFDLFYGGNSPVPSAEEKTIDKEKLAAIVPPVTEETPAFKNIYINNVTCKGAGRAVLLQGLPEMNLKNIKLNNVHIEAIKGIDVIDVDGIDMKNVFVSAEQGPVLKIKNGKNSSFEKFSYQSKEGVNITGELTSSLSFKKSDFSNANQITISPEVKKGNVKVE